ncbi:MAG: tRNA lysidine(34) synthetase TilS [Rhodospirillales bacterium]|nr:tRNA lysidine(34) synthetase TilS [Rhodospirillales bacterium]
MPLDPASNPVTIGEFNELMSRCGPFEPAPQLAVGVSGGSDSMALALLAADWAKARGGSVTALTVDHGLRSGARAEARRVACWLSGRGIDHHVLRWTGIKPASGIQAAARRARFDLLSRWCRGHGVLHLLLGHQREDQAETYMLRLARGSGPDGLACMSGVSETPWLRILRPCLGIPRARLRAALQLAGQEWIDDPSNLNTVFARVRVRTGLAESDEGEPAIDRLFMTAGKLGLARRALDGQIAGLLGRAVSIHPAGYCHFDMAMIASAPEEIGRRALARIVTCIGAQEYGPRRERLDRLYRALRDDGLRHPRTLAGCVIARRRGGVLVAREAAATAPEVILRPGVEAIWDGRFRLRLSRKVDGHRRISIGALGREGWAGLTAIRPEARKSTIPPLVRPTLPVFRDKDGLLAAPHFGYYRDGPGIEVLKSVDLRFFPGNALVLAAFPVV